MFPKYLTFILFRILKIKNNCIVFIKIIKNTLFIEFSKKTTNIFYSSWQTRKELLQLWRTPSFQRKIFIQLFNHITGSPLSKPENLEIIDKLSSSNYVVFISKSIRSISFSKIINIFEENVPSYVGSSKKFLGLSGYSN